MNYIVIERGRLVLNEIVTPWVSLFYVPAQYIASQSQLVPLECHPDSVSRMIRNLMSRLKVIHQHPHRIQRFSYILVRHVQPAQRGGTPAFLRLPIALLLCDVCRGCFTMLCAAHFYGGDVLIQGPPCRRCSSSCGSPKMRVCYRCSLRHQVCMQCDSDLTFTKEAAKAIINAGRQRELRHAEEVPRLKSKGQAWIDVVNTSYDARIAQIESGSVADMHSLWSLFH